MKKFYFLILLALLAVPSLYAQDGRLFFGYCSDNVTGIQVPDNKLYGAAAICIPASQTAEWAGNTISGVSLGFGSGRSKNITIFISYDLDEAPVYTYSTKIRQYKNWNEYKLPDAPVIEAGQDIYVGYYIACSDDADYLMGFNDEPTQNRNSCLVASAANADGLWGAFSNKGNRYGPACIRAIVSGDNVPVDRVNVQSLNPPMYMMPGNKYDFSATIRNAGSNYVNSVDVTATCGGVPTTAHIDLDTPLPPNCDAVITVPGCSVNATQVPCPVSLTFDKVNGNDAGLTVEGVTAAMEPVTRMFLIEEDTGTGCSYCTRGMYAMEYMHDTYYKDGALLPFVVHASKNFISEYSLLDYRDVFVANGVTGLPNCVINRPGYATDPMKPVVEAMYTSWRRDNPYSPYKLDLELLSKDNDTARVRCTLYAAYTNTDANFALTFVGAEDSVTYLQNNNYSGRTDSYEIAGHFVDDPAWVNVTVNSLARSVVDVMGIENSVPGELEADHSYTYECDVPITKIANKDNGHISVLLLDLDKKGAFVNGARMYLKDGKQLGVDGLAPEQAEAAPEYFNLQGMRVAEPQPGTIYIVRRGVKATKVLF